MRIAETLGCALPVYSRVAEESPLGHGSISMLERLLRGWTAKFLVLVLLGFPATDFIITQTLSAADAAETIAAGDSRAIASIRVPQQRPKNCFHVTSGVLLQHVVEAPSRLSS